MSPQRLKKSIIDEKTGEELENWVILDALPEFDAENKFIGVTGSKCGPNKSCSYLR